MDEDDNLAELSMETPGGFTVYVFSNQDYSSTVWENCLCLSDSDSLMLRCLEFFAEDMFDVN